MRQRTVLSLLAIVVLVAIAAWVDWPGNPGIHVLGIDRDIRIHEGLDLQGGIQVLLEAKPPAGTAVTSDMINAARDVVENRINGLGVTEPLIQIQGANRILVELPGIDDPEKAIAVFGEQGLLELIDSGSTPLSPGTVVKTTEQGLPVNPTGPDPVYQTIILGKDIDASGVNIGFDQLNKPYVAFRLQGDAVNTFAQYTRDHVGQYMPIVMDKKVISSPRIESAITQGTGQITGVTLDEAKKLTLQLKYGALPVPLQVVENRTVGPTLGQDSVQKSIEAGAIGLGVVVLFMLLYFRLPGLIAGLALAIYALLVFALFKLIPVTLTLAGIAGFILSIGMAVDANVLIFARMKEELRHGKTLRTAIEAGFDRAWPSIRDSNVSTFITCAILYYFGASSIIKGFAVTLFLGVAVSMFTAITITRSLLAGLQQGFFPARVGASYSHRVLWWFGLDAVDKPAVLADSAPLGPVSTAASPPGSAGRGVSAR